MFIDANELEKPAQRFDICIVGAGAAGITLAKALKDTRHSVCLLESGGFEFDGATQALYAGESVGFPYYPLMAARLRYFGGTMGHWGGCCWPMEAYEFTQRDWVPYSGWPITRADLDPYYRQAHEICELGPYNYDPEYWSEQTDRPLLPLESGRVVTRLYQNSPPTRFGTAYREDIEKARNITCLLNANVTGIDLDKVNETVSRVTVQTLGDKRFDVEADNFVLAAGGLENPRLMLLNDIGNQNDLVGRFFMEHIGLPAAQIVIPGSVDTAFYQRAPAGDTEIRGGLALRHDVLEKERILNSWSGFDLARTEAIKLQYHWRSLRDQIAEGELPDDMAKHVKRLLREVKGVVSEKWQDEEDWVTIPLHNHSEQAPNPDSRVLLSDEPDALGQRRIKLDWRITDLDRHSIRRAQEIIAAEIGKSSLGRAKILAPEQSGAWNDPASIEGTPPNGSWHHMGTTRMHNDPKQGVVDENCQVHGVKNLYVAGSSVFTTCGFYNPTLTLIALAYRLGDYLANRG